MLPLFFREAMLPVLRLRVDCPHGILVTSLGCCAIVGKPGFPVFKAQAWLAHSTNVGAALDILLPRGRGINCFRANSACQNGSPVAVSSRFSATMA